MPLDLNLIVEHLTEEKNALIGEADKLEHGSKMLYREANLMEEEAKRIRKEADELHSDAVSVRSRAETIDVEIQKLHEYCVWASPDKPVCEPEGASKTRQPIKPPDRPPTTKKQKAPKKSAKRIIKQPKTRRQKR